CTRDVYGSGFDYW
nr:immunoglobulin heavy chain junction region [Macaca mulatta]MOX59715.1 immunoglobulin heavy chain junction region [Macaca mulatta]MOX59767.1 immunoglobulin heavy chain junction region [Macaca mulatta]MOX59933.1 immunoglobulin heavy chain junction region [Macaca mulatta]MOX63178.1 immunoglobulin heavy chain junction region [Macaca mulatta]